jgi:uncharacterized protein
MSSLDVALVVMAKNPVAGRSKTRLCPPCTPSEAAGLADAALRDTIDTVLAVGASRCVLALDERREVWARRGLDMVVQRGGGLAERLSGVAEDVRQPLVLVGMDTPQLDVGLLTEALERTARGRAQLGPATDGGWWAIGLPDADPAVFEGVPMSRSDTGERQLERLEARFGEVESLPVVRDVDHWSDAVAVAELAPGTRFAREVRRLHPRMTELSA